MNFAVSLVLGYFLLIVLLMFCCVFTYLACKKYNICQSDQITEKHCCHDVVCHRGVERKVNSFKRVEFCYRTPLMKLKDHRQVSNYATVSEIDTD